MSSQASEFLTHGIPDAARRAPLAKRAEGAIGNLFRASLDERLRTLSGALEAGLSDDEIYAFTKARHMLAHEMRFSSRQDLRAQAIALRFVIDRLLLGLLDYRGPHVDCRTMSRTALPARGSS